MKEDDVRKLLVEAFEQTAPRADGWCDLADVGSTLRRLKADFNYKTLGFQKLSYLVGHYDSVFEVRPDDCRTVARIKSRTNGKDRNASDHITARPASSAHHAAVKPVDQGDNNIKRDVSLSDWAFIPRYYDEIAKLRNLALKGESWGEKGHDPKQANNNRYPILCSYIYYTFFRLMKEGKVCSRRTEHGSIAAFDTGLVDDRYESIYAVFEENKHPEKQQQWGLYSFSKPFAGSGFCIAGEDYLGKALVRSFNPLPAPANYSKNISDLFYDTSAGDPILDYEHIIIENVDRLPPAFLMKFGPKEFIFRDSTNMTKEDRGSYCESLARPIKANRDLYRDIKERIEHALKLSLKRVRWNFKTAIPQYFPRYNKISLLLPLALQSDDKVDVALVVERTVSGNYQGQTILPLDWAYSNARLISRPASDWLSEKPTVDDWIRDAEEPEADEENTETDKSKAGRDKNTSKSVRSSKITKKKTKKEAKSKPRISRKKRR